MAVVEAETRDFATLPPKVFEDEGEEYREEFYVLPFGKNQYYVPSESIMSMCKRTNVLKDGAELGKILNTRAPAAWYKSLHPDFLIRLKAPDGSNCVYTTFSVPGHPEERRLLRFVNGNIATKAFTDWKKSLAAKNVVASNERQQARLDVLNWEKKTDCPERAQLSPDILKWTVVGKIPSIDKSMLSTCRIDPPKESAGKGTKGIKKNSQDTTRYVSWEQFLDVGPKGTYSVDELPGFIRVTQFKVASGSAPAPAEEEVEEEADENE